MVVWIRNCDPGAVCNRIATNRYPALTKTTTSDRKSTKTNRIGRTAWVVLFILACLTCIAIRIRLLNLPLERDEGEYAYAGQLMLHGIAPYKLAYNMKFPGTYAAYAMIMSLFGQTTVGVHLGLLLVNLATVGLVLLIGLRLVNWETGLAAATTYVVLAINPAVMGLAAHATHFVVLFTLAGLLLLVGDTSSSSLASIFISGLLLGVAVLMKQPGIMFLIFGFFWLLYRQRKQPLPRLLSILAVFTFAALTITNYCNRCDLGRRYLEELLVLVRPIRASVRNQHLDQRGMGFVSKQRPSGNWRMLAHLAIERSRAGYCFGKARQIQAAVSGRFDNRVCSRGINGIVFSAALLRHASTGIVIVCWRCSCLRCGNAAPDYAGNRPFGLCHFRGVSNCDARRILLSDVPSRRLPLSLRREPFSGSD